MTDNHMLFEAQMHAECLNEAWCELCGIGGVVTPERKKVIEAEISVRVWAVIYLVQAHKSGNLSADAIETIKEANRFNGPIEDDCADITGAH